ncbi:hypothetical protein [Lysinibacillus phage vB_LspM-01]|nr:hypothetical protein [Lysinibacillus phage vB_LspM-01]
MKYENLTLLEKMLWYLPSKFTKNPKSNIGKLFKIFSEHYRLVEKDFEKQLAWRDINKAEGAVLDELGKMVGVYRGTWDDAQYRVRIKTGIARNISDGTINKVIETLAATLRIDVSQITIDTEWQNGIPATIRISSIPYKALIESGVTQQELIEITKLIVAAGINVETLQLDGTFQYSSQNGVVEVDNTKGFSDPTGTTGGYYGALLEVKE